ncbi:uncharacterized protein N7458_003755 [Penicillium daleae]|uniref:Uncharacterized protein n=1 Tax=Penicillium daleae TaxID=63821 RepID=A0AAD6C8Z7_9EURO|nr:uncharacterized protein N7458_003755 [Penicillium daleae]KAJ5455491.1 hypothetical protein N7458_003755 [Penicillium daleae]
MMELALALAVVLKLALALALGLANFMAVALVAGFAAYVLFHSLPICVTSIALGLPHSQTMIVVPTMAAVVSVDDAI